MKIVLIFAAIIISLIFIPILALALDITPQIPKSLRSIEQDSTIAKLSPTNEVKQDSINVNIDGDKEAITEFNQQTGELKYKGLVETSSGNVKDMAEFQDKEVFLISDSDWHDVLTLVPTTIWTNDDMSVTKYPTMIYHQESTCVDADSIIDILKRFYHASRITIVTRNQNNIPQDLLAELDKLSYKPQIVYENPDALIGEYWNSYSDVVIVGYNNYKEALLASTYASLINAPVLFLSNSNYQNNINKIKSKNAIVIGSLDSSIKIFLSSNAKTVEYLTIEQLQDRYVELTKTNKMILVNPLDMTYSYGDFNKGQFYNKMDPFLSCTVTDILTKNSLSAPLLASGRHELIVTADLRQAVTEPSSVANCNPSQELIFDNIELIKRKVAGPMGRWFSSHQEAYLTIMASPDVMPESFRRSCFIGEGGGSDTFRTSNDYYSHITFSDVWNVRIDCPNPQAGNICEASGVAKDNTGNYYILDRIGKYSVNVFNSNKAFVKRWGEKTSFNSNFKSPANIAIKNNKAYITDTGLNKVVVFDLNGNLISQFGSYGTANSQFNKPDGIALDDSGNIYVADSGNKKLKKFDSSGNFILSTGTDVVLSGPSDVVFNSGYLYLADKYTGRIHKIDTSLKLIKTYTNFGTYSPVSLSIKDNLIYVLGNIPSSGTSVRVSLFDLEAERIIKQISKSGYKTGMISGPVKVFVDSDNTVIVTSKYNLPVQSLSNEASLDFNLYTGRIYGVTMADTSSYIARSLFYNTIFRPEKEYRTALLYYGFGGDEKSLDFIERLHTKYTFFCAGLDSPLCQDNHPQPTNFENKDIIYGSAHGGVAGYPGYTFPLPLQRLSFSVADSCANGFYWWSGSVQNVAVNALRRGAMSAYVAVDTTNADRNKIEAPIKYATANTPTDLGHIADVTYKASEAFQRDYIFMGDPALELHFEEVNWR